jgi:hypothetical protein
MGPTTLAGRNSSAQPPTSVESSSRTSSETLAGNCRLRALPASQSIWAAAIKAAMTSPGNCAVKKSRQRQATMRQAS